MRRSLQALGLVGLLGMALGTANVAQAATSCGPMSGSYGVLVNGENVSTSRLKYLTGTLTFSGCAISGQVAIGSEGSIGGWLTASGSVASTANGTLTITLNVPGFPSPQVYSVGYSSAAMEALGIEIDGLANGNPLGSLVTASIDLQAQVVQTTVTTTSTTPCPIPLLCILVPPKTTTTTTAAPTLSYANSTLSGAWVASCSSPQGSTDVNYINFDGKGNILSTSEDNFNNFGGYGTANYSGNYNVTSDGRLSGVASVGGNAFNFVGVIDNQQTEIQYFYYTGSGAVTGCTGKKV